MNKVQHENWNLSNKLKEVEHVVKKIKTYNKSMLNLINSIRKPIMI